jgi:hypothetical protein
LYVADTLGNRVTMIDHALSRTSSAGTGRTLSAGGSLNGPLGLVVTPGGHVLTVNSGDGFITEISPHGVQVAKKQLDNTPVPGSPPGAGHCLVWRSIRSPGFISSTTAATRSTCYITEGASRAARATLLRAGMPRKGWTGPRALPILCQIDTNRCSIRGGRSHPHLSG